MAFLALNNPGSYLGLGSGLNPDQLATSNVIKIWENQDTSPNSELVIGEPNIELVNILKAVITAPRPAFNTLPNPNLV